MRLGEWGWWLIVTGWIIPSFPACFTHRVNHSSEVILNYTAEKSSINSAHLDKAKRSRTVLELMLPFSQEKRMLVPTWIGAIDYHPQWLTISFSRWPSFMLIHSYLESQHDRPILWSCCTYSILMMPQYYLTEGIDYVTLIVKMTDPFFAGDPLLPMVPHSLLLFIRYSLLRKIPHDPFLASGFPTAHWRPKSPGRDRHLLPNLKPWPRAEPIRKSISKSRRRRRRCVSCA